MSQRLESNLLPAGQKGKQIGIVLCCLASVVCLLISNSGVRRWLVEHWVFNSRAPVLQQTSDATSTPSAPTPSATAPRRPAAPLPGTASSISKQPQPLLLIATHPGATPRAGTASIGTQASNPQTYLAGALLVNGARLAEIHEEFVVLERAGQRAKLFLANRAHQEQSALLSVGGEAMQVKPVAANHTDALVQYLRPSPVYEGEVLKGYQVYAGPRSQLFTQLGLQSGDVILALDGVPFADPQQAIAALEQLTVGRTLLATLERGGRVEQVKLDGGVLLTDQTRTSLP